MRMAIHTADPLVEAQEAALLLLSRLMLWIWTPMLALIALLQGRELLERPVLLSVVPMSMLSGWLLRPSPRRPARARALVAAGAIGFAVTVALFMNGFRAANVVGLSLVLTLLLTLRGRRANCRTVRCR